MPDVTAFLEKSAKLLSRVLEEHQGDLHVEVSDLVIEGPGLRLELGEKTSPLFIISAEANKEKIYQTIELKANFHNKQKYKIKIHGEKLEVKCEDEFRDTANDIEKFLKLLVYPVDAVEDEKGIQQWLEAMVKLAIKLCKSHIGEYEVEADGKTLGPGIVIRGRGAAKGRIMEADTGRENFQLTGFHAVCKIGDDELYKFSMEDNFFVIDILEDSRIFQFIDINALLPLVGDKVLREIQDYFNEDIKVLIRHKGVDWIKIVGSKIKRLSILTTAVVGMRYLFRRA
jgi:hypothetical protein